MIAGIVIGVLAVLALQGIGLMLIRQFKYEDSRAEDETAEAAMYWYALTAWPFYIVPYLRQNRRARTHESDTHHE